MKTAKTVAFIFAALFVAAVLIGCSSKTSPVATGTANTPTGDAAGLDSAFDAQPVQADPTANLPTGTDVANVVN